MEAKTGLTYPISRARKALLYWKIPTFITVHVHNVYFQARKIRLSSQSVRLFSCTVWQFHCFSFPLIFYSFPHLYQGLQITGKQRISAWELMEGYKNPSPLSWAWFGAVRIERKPLRYEQDFRRLLHHTHPRRRPLSYFLSPAPDKEDEQDEEEDRILEYDSPSDYYIPSLEQEADFYLGRGSRFGKSIRFNSRIVFS